MKGSGAIRPIASFKKENPEIYKHYLDAINMLGLKGGSKKQEENNFYYAYALLNSGIDMGTQENFNPFLFDKTGKSRNNVTTFAEMGRLLLTGWYYSIQEYARTLCGYIDRIYNNTAEQDRPLITGLMTDAVNHLRDNLPYYEQHQDAAKLYLLQTLAKDEIAHLEPEKPAKLALVDEAIKIAQGFNRKHDKQYFIELADNQEVYIEYLQEELDQRGIPYMTYEEKMEAVESELKPFYEDIARMENERQANMQAAILGNKLLT